MTDALHRAILDAELDRKSLGRETISSDHWKMIMSCLTHVSAFCFENESIDHRDKDSRLSVSKRLSELSDHIRDDNSPYFVHYEMIKEPPFIEIKLLLSALWGG